MSFWVGTVKERALLRSIRGYLWKASSIFMDFILPSDISLPSSLYIYHCFCLLYQLHLLHSPSSFRAGNVVWARLNTTRWPGQIVDRKAIYQLDTSRVWTSECRSKCIVNFFKQGSTVQLVKVSLIREYTSNMTLLNSAGRMRGAVFLACQDANYWIRRNGNKHQKDRVSDPLFLLNSIQVRGNLAHVKKHKCRR